MLLTTTGFQDAKGRLELFAQKLVDKALATHTSGNSKSGILPEKLNQKPWKSIRANDDIRLIFQSLGEVDLFFYVDYHDKAYDWAKTHRHESASGALVTLTELHEQKIEVHTIAIERQLLFSAYSKEYLLSLGVPPNFMDSVRNACTDDTFLEYADSLPEGAWNALCALKEGTPVTSEDQPKHCLHYLATIDPDLRFALDGARNAWAVYLHPQQRQITNAKYRGPARVFGSAGTGKSVTLLHRAVALADTLNPPRILVTAHNAHTVAKLSADLDTLLGSNSSVRVRIETTTLSKVAYGMGERLFGKHPHIFTPKDLVGLFAHTLKNMPDPNVFPDWCSPDFLAQEWESVVETQSLSTFEQYQNIARTGRKRALSESQREIVWLVFERAQTSLSPPRTTFGRLMETCSKHLLSEPSRPYDHILVDEAQLLTIAALRFVRALASDGPNDLFFALDGNQRLFRRSQPWTQAGIDIANRSSQLLLNYRTTRQIAAFAGEFAQEISADFSSGGRPESYADGQRPEVSVYSSADAEILGITGVLRELWRKGIEPRDIAIFAHSVVTLHERAEPALAAVGIRSCEGTRAINDNCVTMATMNLAIGLEFRAVILIGCEEGCLRMGHESEHDCDELESRTRLLSALYVACSRAREILFVTAAGPLLPAISAAYDATKS